MEVCKKLGQVFRIHAQVAFGREQRRVPKKSLNVTDVGPPFEKVGRKRMPQNVWMDSVDTRTLGSLIQTLPDSHSSQGLGTTAREHDRPIFFGEPRRPSRPESVTIDF
jgi:hypothetical protein